MRTSAIFTLEYSIRFLCDCDDLSFPVDDDRIDVMNVDFLPVDPDDLICDHVNGCCVAHLNPFSKYNVQQEIT